MRLVVCVTTLRTTVLYPHNSMTHCKIGRLILVVVSENIIFLKKLCTNNIDLDLSFQGQVQYLNVMLFILHILNSESLQILSLLRVFKSM